LHPTEGTVPGDVLSLTERVAEHCGDREYMKANEAYLLMAIGNQAWPMGVSAVSIHMRTGREKISSGGVAHVLNDERARKYVQAIKRLMTFAQDAYPPSGPSKRMG
jgi:pre-mRNA-splicing factor 18